jgi:hypothetical protein
MRFLKQVFRNLISSPTTSALGITTLVEKGRTIADNPAAAADPLVVGSILGGIALLGSPDPWKALPRPPAQPPAK